MADQLENRPSRNPLPIALFLALFPVYVVGIRIGLDIRFTELLGIFTEWEGHELRRALIFSMVPFLGTLTVSLWPIRMIVGGTHRTAGFVLYIACCVLCMLIGMFIVPVTALQ